METAYSPVVEEVVINSATINLRRLMAEKATRQAEALKMYVPTDEQAPFHASSSLERIIRGPNRSGKTRCALVEIARAVTNQDPYGKYPREGVCYIVGKQGKEISQVLYPVLFRAGAFSMIRDEVTKKWRMFLPDLEWHRRLEVKRTPPLIPPRFVKSIAWTDKKANLPNVIHLTTGWQVHYYSSEGKPTQGSAIDLALFDEELLERTWYAEIAARLVDRRGKFVWSATPQAGTEKLYDLYERAMEEEEKKILPRTVEHFFVSAEKNIYVSKFDKEAIAAKFANDEEEYLVRVKGEFAIMQGRYFPEYSPKIHEVDPTDSLNREIPADWTRYVSIDPGRTVCAVTFYAVPPPEFGDYVYCYDELYLKECSASIFGMEMGKKAQTQTFHAFIIDMNEAQKHDTGGGKKILDQYTDALMTQKCKSTTTGYGFIPGFDNVNAGIEAVRHWLQFRPSQEFPKLRILKRCKNLIDEIKSYRRQKIKDVYVDKPVKKHDHAVDSLRYLVSYGPRWVQSKSREEMMSPAYRQFLKMQPKQKYILLGAGGYNDERHDSGVAG